MANWSDNPTYTELDQIMTEEATRKVGLTAEQFNKVMYNIAYLKKLYDLYKCEIGTVTVNYVAPGTPFDVSITHRQATVNSELVDYLDFVFTVAVAEISTSVASRSVAPTSPAKATVTATPLPSGRGYNFGFDFDIPKGEIGDAECSNSSSSGQVSYTLVNNTDKTFTSAAITRLNLTIPASVSHGFFAGVNFKVSNTPTVLNFINNSSYPLKLMRRATGVSGYSLSAGKTVMLVVNCDGLNVYCNLIEV